VITHASRLRRTTVRISAGVDDPFHPGQLALAQTLGADTTTYIGPGCHDHAFFASQEPPSLEFIAAP
jgi:hypothetical protein